jgi:hypothetical protein
MSDDDAYMALVTSNSQSELTPLERGLHALGATVKGDPEKGVRAYAGTRGKTPGTQVGISLLAIHRPSISKGFVRPTRLRRGSLPGLLPLVPEV